MYGQTSFTASKDSSAAPKNLTTFLIGIIVCYQIVSQFILHQAVTQEDEDFESDAGCSAQPGGSGYSSLCMEAQLFKGWQEDLPAETPEQLQSLLVESPASSQKPSEPATTSASPSQKLRGSDEVAEENIKVQPKTASATEAPVTSKPKDGPEKEIKTEDLESVLWDLVWKMGGGNQSHAAPEKMRKPVKKSQGFMAKKHKKKPHKKSFSEGLTSLQHKLEAKMQKQARKHAEHRKLRALSAAARGHHIPSEPEVHQQAMTPWAEDLDHLTHDLEDHMQKWRRERASHAAAIKSTLEQAPSSKNDPLTPWAHKLDDMTHDIQHHMEEREKERSEHAAAHAARMKAIHAGHVDAEIRTPFMDEIDKLGRELCQDPSRHGSPACAQFLAHEPSSTNHTVEEKSHKEKHENAMAHIKLLEQHLHDLEKDRQHDTEEIRQESNEFLKELCADPARHSYPTCAQLLAKNANGKLRSSRAPSVSTTRAATTKQSAAVLPQHHGPLHWTALNESDVTKRDHGLHADAAPLVVFRKDLRAARWEGKIPKVACITVLPQGQVTETLMRYFMDNYKLQHYEGEKELIMIYHHQDKEAARIAHLHTEEKGVKAAAAHGEGDFPSTTAYRFGAWLAHDADLMVRWDFEAWHHPHRIAMQARAIALSSRSASIVARVTAFDADGKNGTVAGAGPHGSLMGDAMWMRKHWMPVIEEESTFVHGLHSSDIAQIVMPELVAYHDVSLLGTAKHSWVDVDNAA